MSQSELHLLLLEVTPENPNQSLKIFMRTKQKATFEPPALYDIAVSVNSISCFPSSYAPRVPLRVDWLAVVYYNSQLVTKLIEPPRPPMGNVDKPHPMRMGSDKLYYLRKEKWS